MSAQTELDAVEAALKSRAWERIHETQPGNPGAVASWGNFLREQGRHTDAVNLLEQALTHHPDNADILLNLGVCHQEARKSDLARSLYERILVNTPGHAIALYNLGCMANETGALKESQEWLKRSVAANPDYLDAVSMLLRVSQQMCDWSVTEALEVRCVQAVENGQTVFPFAFLSLPATQHQQSKCARQWYERRYGKRQAMTAQQRDAAHKANKAKLEQTSHAPANGRIRVGLLSSDYHDHPTSRLLVGAIEQMDRARFEVFAFSGGPDDGSAMQQRIRRAFEHVHVIRNLTDLQTAQHIAGLGIDVLIDLGGYTANSRTGVLAYKPASVQAQFLGYPGSVQMPGVDYVFTDRTVTPAHSLPCYSEQPAWLPHSYQCNDDRRDMFAGDVTRASEGLPDNAVVLASLNQSYKIRRDLFESWCRILKRCDNSVLWLLRFNDEAVENLRKAAAANGIDPDRIIFAKPAANALHQSRLALADIFLDTWIYNSHTTASDALWVGKPLVTLQGQTFASRVAAGILKAAHLDALVTDSVADYEARVVQLIEDPAFARLIGKALSGKRLQWPLFDTRAWTRAFENLLQQMHALSKAGLAPVPLYAQPETHTMTVETMIEKTAVQAAEQQAESATKAESTPIADVPATQAEQAGTRRELLIGCGSNHTKKLCLNNRTEWDNLTTLDYNGDHNPDIVHDLMVMPLPFEDNTFDEIHAYEVLEHTGAQGDYKFFFKQFEEFYRILKPGGVLMATCPSRNSPWAWGDPSHTRIVQPENLIFLDQAEYIRQVGKTAMSDFRNIYSADFSPVFAQDDGMTFSFALKAVKPSRHRRPTR